MQACKEHAGFCSRVLPPLSPSRLLQGRTLVQGITLWPQSQFSDSCEERFLYLLMRIAEELPNSTLTIKVHVHRERNGSALVTITDTGVDAILTLKAAFDKPVSHVLDKSDSGCPNEPL